jgi:DNA-binding CsgD family transcriptional regulator
MNDSTFDAIVGGFFRAASGAIDWDTALGPVQEAFGARACLLHTLDLSNGRLLALHAGGPDLGNALFDYIGEYHLIDPRREHAMKLGAAGLGTWQHDHETFDEPFVAQDRFFRHYLPAHGSRWNSTVTIPIDATVITGFVLELPRARGPLDLDERETARRLGEHMREALFAYQRTLRLMQQSLAGHALLSSFPYPMWLIDDARCVTFQNPAAAAEIERGQRVAQQAGRLVLTRGKSDLRLVARIEALRERHHGESAVVDLRSHDDEPPAWLHLSKMVPDQALGVFGSRPMLVATLFDPQHVSAVDPHALGRMVGLSPTEARVAALLADGRTAEEIGAQHGTAVATVRTQVRAVLEKLGASRSVEVVRMLRQGEVLWAAKAARQPG